MNRIKAFFYTDKQWFKEIYQVYYDPPLSEHEKNILSDYTNKRQLQNRLQLLGVDLYQYSGISLKDAVRIITNGL